MSCRRSGSATSGRGTRLAASRRISAGPDGSLLASHHELGDYRLEIGPAPDGTQPTLLFCENETNLARIDKVPSTTPYPKDGINDHVVDGAATVNPDGTGTKAAAWYQVTVPAGGAAELRLRLSKPRGRESGKSKAAARNGDGGDQGGRSARHGIRHRHEAPAGRGRRVLREPPARGRHRRRADDHAPGVRRDALEQAVLRLQRRPLAGRRSRPAAATRDPQDGSERRLAALRCRRHPVDARPMGIPLVRGLGSGLPRGHLRAYRSDLRQVPAAAAVSRVVPASRMARCRPTSGTFDDVNPPVHAAAALLVWHDRRPARHRLPQADLPQAAARTSPGG